MKYGILGDIHGNLEALEVVLEEMEKEGVKRHVSVGDLVGYGANPRECIRKVRELNAVVVVGNHDFAAIGYLNLDFFNAYARSAIQWTHENLSEEDKHYLANLKLAQECDNFILVHSTLSSPELFEYIQTSYDAHLSFDIQNTKLCFVGHSHIPVNFIKHNTVIYNMDTTIRIEDEPNKYMINVGSIGQPRDENPRAVCCIYNSDKKIITIKRLVYNIDKAAKKIINAGLPVINAERLKMGR